MKIQIGMEFEQKRVRPIIGMDGRPLRVRVTQFTPKMVEIQPVNFKAMAGFTDEFARYIRLTTLEDRWNLVAKAKSASESQGQMIAQSIHDLPAAGARLEAMAEIKGQAEQRAAMLLSVPGHLGAGLRDMLATSLQVRDLIDALRLRAYLYNPQAMA